MIGVNYLEKKMEFNSIGLGQSITFLIFVIFVCGGLWFTYTAVKIIDKSFKKNTGKSILFQLYFVLGYSLIGVLYRQALNLKLIHFSNTELEFYLNLILGVIYIVFCLCVLWTILNTIRINDKEVS